MSSRADDGPAEATTAQKSATLKDRAGPAPPRKPNLDVSIIAAPSAATGALRMVPELVEQTRGLLAEHTSRLLRRTEL